MGMLQTDAPTGINARKTTCATMPNAGMSIAAIVTIVTSGVRIFRRINAHVF
jgi:hypothetical protein